MRERSDNRRYESGQGMLEYVMIVVFVALAGMTVWRVFGQNIRTMVERANSQLVEGFEDTQRDRGGALPRIR